MPPGRPCVSEYRPLAWGRGIASSARAPDANLRQIIGTRTLRFRQRLISMQWRSQNSGDGGENSDGRAPWSSGSLPKTKTSRFSPI